MPKIKTLTSMNRDGVSIQNNAEIEVPEADALALCLNGLATPIDFRIEDGAIAGTGAKKKAAAKDD